MLQHQITITNMKKPLLLALSLVAIATSLSAQTLRPGVVLNADSCYQYYGNQSFEYGQRHYNVIETNYVPLVQFYGELTINVFNKVGPGLNDHQVFDMSVKYPAHGGTTVYGIAVTAREPLREHMYLDLSTCDSTLSVLRLNSASYEDPYILGEYMYEAYFQDGRYENLVSPAYEYYFDRPIFLEDSFFVGIRINFLDVPYEPYDYNSPLWYQMAGMIGRTLLFHLSNITTDTLFTHMYGGLGHFFPIVKLPCPRLDRPYLGANVGGMALFTWDTVDGATYQIGISQGDDSSYSFVHLSDTLRDSRYTYTGSLPEGWYNAHLRRSCTYCFSGADTLVWSRWSEGRRFYYTPDPAAIAPSDLQPPPFDLYPNPTTGILNVELGNLDFEGAATLQLLDLEGRLLQEFKIPDSKSEIDISTLPSGTYLVRAAGATRRVVKK